MFLVLFTKVVDINSDTPVSESLFSNAKNMIAKNTTKLKSQFFEINMILTESRDLPIFDSLHSIYLIYKYEYLFRF